MTKHFVLVAGNIGAGKTSLTERLAARMGWRAAYESVADNPYLADFYGDMRAWGFHLQVFFLGHRAAQHKGLALDSQSAIIDRSIYEDAYIFARALYEMGSLTERDYLSYRRLFDLVVSELPPPDLLIYLRAPVPVLMIESDNLDFAHRSDHLDVVVARIEDRLTGKERLVFPK